LKILPNIVEKPEPDIEKLKKEEYVFKKEEKEKELLTHHADSSIETNEIDSVLLTSTTTIKPIIAEEEISTNFIAPTLNIFTSTKGDEQHRMKPATPTESDDEYDYATITEHREFEKTVTPHATTGTHGTVSDTTIPSVSFDSLEKKKYGVDEDDDDGDIEEGVDEIDEKDKSGKEYYDSNSEEERDNRQSKVVHKAMQHTLPSSTLLHGFIANPGFPSYYIGSDRDCKWRIKIAKGQKMTLTILDLHLRSK
jgi:hypothetical protein